ncbi:MAG: SpoIIE family protein phosphatase [Candidatus Altiarchaeota archaeon]|nr:SpoIIE family protein phosphatase [Candidatus Altiarchaeota archaeon]
MALASSSHRYRGMVSLPDLFGRFRGRPEKPVYVAVEDLGEQLDAGRFLIDGNPAVSRIDASRLGVACRKGGGEVNNDFVLVHHGLKVGNVLHDLYGVFDGVTGYEIEGGGVGLHPMSHEVSSQAAEGIVRILRSSRMRDAAGALAESLETANKELCASPLYSGKGYTTATVALLNPKNGSGVVGQSGDSRAFFAGKGGLDRLTIDQVSYTAAPDGVRMRHLKPMMGSPDMVYDIRELELSKGGLLLLTTDGVHNALEPATMHQTIMNVKGNLSFAAHDLFYKAQNIARFSGGRVDDASAVVVRI